MRPLPVSPQDRPGDFPRIPTPPEPWAQDARRAADALHLVPAFVPAIVPRAGEPLHPPAPPTPPETDGRHRGRGTWPFVALAVALAGAAVLIGAVR